MHFQQLQALTQGAQLNHPPTAQAQPLLLAPPAPQPVPQALPAGWYPDQQDPQLMRWFDGARWTEHTQPRS
jgi:hypothetical protein